jgi:hypothetical protein
MVPLPHLLRFIARDDCKTRAGPGARTIRVIFNAFRADRRTERLPSGNGGALAVTGR